MELQCLIGKATPLRERALSEADDRQEGSTNVKSRTSDTKSSLTGLIATRRSVLLGLASALVGGAVPMVETDAKPKHRSRKGKRRSSSKKSSFAQPDPSRLSAGPDPAALAGNDACAVAEAWLVSFFPQSATIKNTGSIRASMTVAKDVSDRYCFIPDGEYQISFIKVTVQLRMKLAFGRWISIKPALSGRIRVRFAVDKPYPNTYKFSAAEVLSVEIAKLPSSLQGPVRTAMVAMFPQSFTFTV